MLCDECYQREATVFLTQITDGHMRKVSLCAVCGADTIKLATDQQRQKSAAFRSIIFERLAADDHRYSPQAYSLVFRSVAHAFQAAPPQKHLPASAVATAFREVALSEFGTQALSTLATWGIRSCEDIGAIVFRLIEARLLGSRPEERPDDFSGLYDFTAAFPTST